MEDPSIWISTTHRDTSRLCQHHISGASYGSVAGVQKRCIHFHRQKLHLNHPGLSGDMCYFQMVWV